jgi:peptidase S15 family
LTNAKSKELVTIPGATHCDLYDGGKDKVIPFNKIESFLKENLK